ncbi:MAG: hypothetical protein ACKVIW_13860, partial [bacterium]
DRAVNDLGADLSGRVGEVKAKIVFLAQVRKYLDQEVPIGDAVLEGTWNVSPAKFEEMDQAKAA